MSARRDTVVFLCAALLPSAAIAVLGVRAIGNEGAARERELGERARLEASVVARRISDGTSAATDRLRDPVSPDATMDELTRLAQQAAPPFAQPLVVRGDGRVLWPRAPTRTEPRDATCEATVRGLRTAPTARLKADLLTGCEEARDDRGRWLWPVFALEALARGPDSALSERTERWLEAHRSRMTDTELESTRDDVAALDHGDTRARLSLALEGSPTTLSGEVAIGENAERSEVFRETVRLAVVTMNTPRRVEGDGLFGALVSAQPGSAYGFVTTKASLGRAPSALEVADPRFIAQVVGEPPVGRKPTQAFAPIADGLGVLVSVRDEAAVVRERTRVERLLFSLVALGVGLAVALSTVLYRRMRATQRTSELRTSFVAGVSHELRTPLASIRMLSELLAEGRVEEAERKEVIDALASETNRLSSTVERFLAYAKSERGKLVAAREPGDLSQVVRARCEAFAARTGRRVDFAGERLDASFDPRQIEIVVDNLLENAAKYAPDGEPYAVTVEAPDVDRATITIDDGGPGVPEAATKRIWRAFERADDRLSAAVSGTGLGLFLVRTIAEAHEGGATSSSSPRGGARFVVSLPRRPAR
jgi:two-component system phosphate regulon sensor histidine kinase PhoR